jgi:hypothetical protein
MMSKSILLLPFNSQPLSKWIMSNWQ